MNLPGAPYGLLMLAGIGVSLVLWVRLARRDDRLMLVYLGGLCGAFVGAKLVYLAAEGWLHFGADGMWMHLATGKTILGALLGGYVGVELGKKFLGYQAVTGDLFAVIAPVGILLGRLGCLAAGCCLGSECDSTWYSMSDSGGVSRWPAVPAEISFNVLFLAFVLFLLRPRRILPGQHFHIYLISYGLFRLMHESVRATPKVFGPISGYQIASILLIILGVTRFWQRRQNPTIVQQVPAL